MISRADLTNLTVSQMRLVPKQAIAERASGRSGLGLGAGAGIGTGAPEEGIGLWMGMGSFWQAGGQAGRLGRGRREPKCVAQIRVLPGVEVAEENEQVGAPGEEANDERASVNRNLRGDQIKRWTRKAQEVACAIVLAQKRAALARI